MNAQAQLKKLKKADKLAITKLTTHELMNNAQWAHIPEAHRSQAIQMALMTTDATSGCMCHCEIAKKLKELGIFNDSKDFLQRVLRTIHRNTTFQNGTEYRMDKGPPIKRKRDGSYTHIKGGKLLIPITMLHRFLLGGEFPLLAYRGTYEENAYKCYNKQYAISQQESANAANGARGLLN
mmetsp:Transcript_4367/g.4519  ORF Transcript_4367/g.4519 Transcript_4367/m.4519 type:complete len:180 (+) Transcript_4367:60-599(+)